MKIFYSNFEIGYFSSAFKNKAVKKKKHFKIYLLT